jgi:two-component system phosphate regulon sensor histidine kinase PhoR
MVYNLCDNAIKYNVPGGRVEISITSAPPRFVIKDTGIGIPEDQQKRVFERFYRVDKSHSKDIGGTGLGLSIVKHAAMVHGAQVSVESELGKGSTFFVSFPRMDEATYQQAKFVHDNTEQQRQNMMLEN